MIKKSMSAIQISFLTIAMLLISGSFSFSENKAFAATKANNNKKLVYLVSDARIPFWSIMGRGIKNSANSLGYELKIYSAENSAKRELEFTAKALKIM